MKRPKAGAAILIVALLSAFFVFHAHAAEQPPKEKATWRSFAYPYNHVWNATIVVIFRDRKYRPLAANPQEGYLATDFKEYKTNGRTIRKALNVNVKKSMSGTLVTVTCRIEEAVAVGQTGKLRWSIVPTDGSCEKEILDAIQKKL